MAAISPLKLLKIGKQGNYRAKISVAMREIDFHMKELDNLKFRLGERRRKLFQYIVKAVQDEENSKSVVYANEYSELNKVIKVVEASQLGLMQVTLRLQSMTDIGDAILHMNNAFKVMRDVSKTIQGLLPAMDAASQGINNTLTETMAEMGQLSPTLSINVSTDSSEELIEQARKYAEEQAESLKRDLEVAPAKFEAEIAHATSGTPLLATGEEAGGEESEGGEILGVMYSSPYDERVDDKVLKYAAASEGVLDVAVASSELGIPADKVEHSALKLMTEGKVKIKAGETPQ